MNSFVAYWSAVAMQEQALQRLKQALRALTRKELDVLAKRVAGDPDAVALIAEVAKEASE